MNEQRQGMCFRLKVGGYLWEVTEIKILLNLNEGPAVTVFARRWDKKSGCFATLDYTASAYELELEVWNADRWEKIFPYPDVLFRTIETFDGFQTVRL